MLHRRQLRPWQGSHFVTCEGVANVGSRSGRADQGAGMLVSESDGVTGYASSAGFGVIFTGGKPCKTEKNFNPGADLCCAARKLIRSSKVVTPARCDVDIKLGLTKNMRELQSLIQDLESPSSSVRDKAALDLMDIGNESAVGPLLQAISKPENLNHRGTLVYALGAFNCEPFIEALVDLVLTGNFEVSTGAFGIIQESATSTDAMERVRRQVQKYAHSTLAAEHQKLALEALAEFSEAAGE
jgi:HEAT repeats